MGIFGRLWDAVRGRKPAPTPTPRAVDDGPRPPASSRGVTPSPTPTPRSASAVPRGASVAPRGASVAPRGASVAPRGASVAPRGASVAPRGASVAPRAVPAVPHAPVGTFVMLPMGAPHDAHAPAAHRASAHASAAAAAPVAPRAPTHAPSAPRAAIPLEYALEEAASRSTVSRRPKGPEHHDHVDKHDVDQVVGNIHAHIDAADTPELSDVDRAFLRHFRRGLEKVGPRLPPMPEAVVRIDRVLRKPDCAVSEVADVIRADPVVATKIVGIANSPFYAGLGRIRGVEGAITRMGLRETKSIVQAIALGSRLMRVPGHELEVERLYHHTLAAAVAARIVAQAAHEDPDAAFLGGLIHDIGRSVFLAAVGDFERSNNRRHSPSDALMDHLSDAIHEDLSALVARVWRAGRDIEVAVKFHEHPEEAPAGEGQRLALVLGLADDLARYTLEPATALVPCGDAVRVELAERLGVRDLDALAREIDQAAAAFDLPVVSRVPSSEAPPPYTSISAPGIARVG
jgi:HD-like signal output (HDOD) protein